MQSRDAVQHDLAISELKDSCSQTDIVVYPEVYPPRKPIIRSFGTQTDKVSTSDQGTQYNLSDTVGRCLADHTYIINEYVEAPTGCSLGQTIPFINSEVSQTYSDASTENSVIDDIQPLTPFRSNPLSTLPLHFSTPNVSEKKINFDISASPIRHSPSATQEEKENRPPIDTSLDTMESSSDFSSGRDSVADNVLDSDFYTPSSGSSGAETSGSSAHSDTMDSVPPTCEPHEDKTFIVFETCLMSLFRKCGICGGEVIHWKKRTKGTLLSIETNCCQSHTYLWQSQPHVQQMAAGNLLISSAILFTGNTHTRIKEIANVLNLQFLSEKSFCGIQDFYLFPVVNIAYNEEMSRVQNELSGVELCLSGDGRCDSPGYCAKYCSYTLMDQKSGIIVNTNLIHVSETGGISTNMEKLGCERGLNDVTANLDVSVLATDRHLQIGPLLKKKFEKIDHQFDIWHVSKNIVKKLTKIAKQKNCGELYNWIQSIANHLWWSCATCEGDTEVLTEKWTSIISHIANIHKFTSNKHFQKCEHARLNAKQRKGKIWLKPGTVVYEELVKVVMAKKFLNILPKLTKFCHTGNLEVFHSLITKYCPKRQHFSYKGMQARAQLAVLDHNTNVGRKQAIRKKGTQAGQLRYKQVFTKRRKTWVVKPLKEPKSYAFVDQLVKMVVRAKAAKKIILPTVPVPDLPKNIASKPKPSMTDAVNNHRSRLFGKN